MNYQKMIETDIEIMKSLQAENTRLRNDLEKVSSGIRSGTKQLRNEKKLLLDAIQTAIQTFSNLANSELSGDAKIIAENEVNNLLIIYAKIKS